MSLSIRRRDFTDVDVPDRLERMLRTWDREFRANLSGELRRRRSFIGPGERRRLKARRAAHRHKPK